MSSEPRTLEQYPYQKAVHQEPNPRQTRGSQTPAAEAQHGHRRCRAQPKGCFNHFPPFFNDLLFSFPSVIIFPSPLVSREFCRRIPPTPSSPLSQPSLVDPPPCSFFMLNIQQIFFSCVLFYFFFLSCHTF